MGSIGIFSVVFSMSIFGIILYWGSLAYSFFFSRSGKNLQSRDLYECGFRAIPDNKVVIDIHFSIVGLIFLIYEMEVILFVPLFLNLFGSSFCVVVISILALFILGVSYWYEWDRYGLTWSF